MTIAPTFTAQIYIAGDLATAKQLCRKYCFEIGLCVTIEPVDFIYTGGEESGMRIGLINYPRFPTEAADIKSRALDLARRLRVGLCQHSFSLVTSDETIWESVREEIEAMRAQAVPLTRDHPE